MITDSELNRIIDRTKVKIAVSNFEKEEEKMSKVNILKIVATFVLVIGITLGVTYAGIYTYNKIWKEPKRVNYVTDREITEEQKQEMITEEQAKEKAIEWLEQYGFYENTILNVESFKELPTSNLTWRARSDKNMMVDIDARNGKLKGIHWEMTREDVLKIENYSMTKEAAIEAAKELYKQYGFKEGEYEFAVLTSNSEENAYIWTAWFYKRYNNQYNRYQGVIIGFVSKTKQLSFMRIYDDEFENNPIEVTKEQAIAIVKEKDRKVETEKEIERVEAILSIEKMNGSTYAREVDKDAYYKPSTTINVPEEEIMAYQTEEKVRNVWVVVVYYKEANDETKSEEERVVARYTQSSYSYFVDATTGEIIGGVQMDKIYDKQNEDRYNLLKSE